LRFFPHVKKNHPVLLNRMRTLQGHGQCEDDPTVVLMAAYLLTLDQFCDAQQSKLRQRIRIAEDAEVMVRRLQVRLAIAEARAAAPKATRLRPRKPSMKPRNDTRRS
jgi:hypothetical protein